MLRKLLRLVVVLAIGAVLGYLLTPTIDGLIKKQDVVGVDKVELLKDKANEKADSLLSK